MSRTDSLLTADLDSNSKRFLFRFHNKGVYLKMGIRKILKWRASKELHRLIRMEVDGRRIDLPPVEGLIILNILRLAQLNCRISRVLSYSMNLFST